MNKRKKFAIPTDIQEGLNDIINAVENNAENFRYTVVSLSRIETDPENPRELLLTANDIKNNIQDDDPNLEAKKNEKESLSSLAHTIAKNGLINPVVVYKDRDIYRLVAGERRYLASLLAGKHDIHARILTKKPDTLNLRLLQWAENNERTDLSLKERINNLQHIIAAYCSKNEVEKVNIADFMKLTGLSKPQSACYLSILYGPDNVMNYINSERINNLDKASLIAGVKDDALRNKMLDACANGNSLSQLKKIILDAKQEKREILRANNGKKKPGKAAQYVNLGRTKDTNVIKKLVGIIVTHPDYSHFSSVFKETKWDHFEDVSAVFARILKLLEGEGA